MTVKRILTGTFTLVFGILVTVSIAAAASKVSGALYSIGAKNHTVTLKDKSGKLQTLNVSGATVKRNGKSTQLTGLVIGDKVTAGYKKGGLNPSTLQAKGPNVATVAGPLQGLSASSTSIQVGGKSLKATAQSRIIRNGKIVPLNRLTKSDTVTVHVGASSDCDDIDSEGPDLSEVEGTVSGVDTTANTITISPEDGSPDVTLNVTSTTVITLDDEDATLANIIVGDMADAEYDPTTMDAAFIDAENPELAQDIRGVITALDTTAGTITITSQDGEGDGATSVVTVNVTANTLLTLDDNPAFLTDLAVGDRAEADYDPTTMNAFTVAAESPEVEGTITALDATAGTFTIMDDDGLTISLTADSTTVVTLDGSPSTLASLVVGDDADVTYNAATLVAIQIDASTGDGGGDSPVQHMAPKVIKPTAKTHSKPQSSRILPH